MAWFKSGYKQTDTKDRTASFTQAGTRENIRSGEKHKTLFGKIAKYFSDLKPVAFSGSYNDLQDKPSNLAPSTTISVYPTPGTSAYTLILLLLSSPSIVHVMLVSPAASVDIASFLFMAFFRHVSLSSSCFVAGLKLSAWFVSVGSGILTVPENTGLLLV